MSWSGIKSFLRDALLALGIAFIVWFLWVQLLAPQPKSSGPAPDFALLDVAGQQVELPEEGVVVLNFWFTSCPPCRREIPELAAYHAANPDVAMYGVSVDQMDTRRLGILSRKLGINYPVLHDRHSKVAHDYEVSLFPTTVVVRDGEIRSVKMGEVNRRTLKGMVDAAMR